MTSPETQITLSPAEALSWADDHARALDALRLNKQFPDYRILAQTVSALAQSGSLRLDVETALLSAREWVRARADRELAQETLKRFSDLDLSRLPPEEAQRVEDKRGYLRALLALAPPESRQMHFALRHREGDLASYKVIIDRIDIASGTTARYTIVLTDRPGRRISEGELALAASREFEQRLQLLSTQDAALAFAVLRGEGLLIEEVVRGIVGPGVLPGRAGVPPLRALRRPALSAAVERVSLDLKEGHIDDPIPRPVTIPAQGVDFGLSVQRKWACAESDLPALRAWLSERASRNLVYGY